MWMIKRYMTRCSASLIIKGNADQKHKRYFIPAGKGSTKKCKKRQMLLRMWRKRSAYALLVWMYTRATTMEKYCGGSLRNLKENGYVIHYPTSGYIVKEMKSLSQRAICIPMLTAALLTVALL